MRVAAPQTCDSCITLRAGEADLSNLTVDFFFLGWLDGCFSLNVDSSLSTRSFEKNDQSLALQAGFFKLPGSSGGIQRSLHSTRRTDVEPALLSAADVIWVGVNLWGQQTKKSQESLSVNREKGQREFALLHWLPTSEYRGGGWKRNS